MCIWWVLLLILSMVRFSITHLDDYLLLLLVDTYLYRSIWRDMLERIPHYSDQDLLQIFTMNLHHDWQRGNL
jgi:hypothetical protein